MMEVNASVIEFKKESLQVVKTPVLALYGYIGTQ